MVAQIMIFNVANNSSEIKCNFLLDPAEFQRIGSYRCMIDGVVAILNLL